MPRLSAIATIALLLLPHRALSQETKGSQLFELRPSVLTAIEGGPLVLKTIVKYRGQSPVDIEGGIGQPLILMDGAGERVHSFVRGVGSLGPRRRVMAPSVFRVDPGATLSAVSAVHRNYHEIPAGKCSMKLSWALYSPAAETTRLIGPMRRYDAQDWEVMVAEREKRKLTEFNETIEVVTQPATPENLLACAKKLHALLDKAQSFDDYDLVLQHVLYTPRKEFADVSARLLNCDCLSKNHYEIASGMLTSAATEREGLSSLLKYLSGTAPKAIETVLSLLTWEVPKDRFLTKDTISKLRSTPTIWPRVMVNVLAPNDCSPLWRWQLMQQLKLLRRPLPLEELQEDIKQIDNDSFFLRAKAKGNLIKKGEMAAPTLRELLRGRLSLEAETNVKSVIASIEKAPPDALEQQMMNCLAGCLLHNRYEEYFNDNRAEHLRQVENVLEALAQNHPDAWITKEARRILAEAKQRKEKQQNK